MKATKGFLSGIKETFNFNKKASGIMDVIVVQHEDGSLHSSPFHVHFGRGKILHSENQFVDIYHMGQPTGVCLKLDRNGLGSFHRLLYRRTAQLPPIDPEEKPDSPTMNLSMENERHAGLLDSNESFDSFLSEPREAEELPDNNLSSNELKYLKLNPGLNILDFVVRENPTVYMRAKVYLWQANTKIVISDIDGTLTKSDLMGHVCHLVGTDCTRGGVVYFYNKLLSKGYKILYLTARSLAQLDSTRGYLMQIRQDGQTLPDGPLILNHVGMMNALMSELAKKSKIFKEKVLKVIHGLFPKNPFISGIGNRVGDSLAYAAVGIRKEMIFIIDKKGREKGEHVTIRNFKDPKLKID